MSFTADFERKAGRIDRENAFHGRFREKNRGNRPRERLSRLISKEKQEESTERTSFTAGFEGKGGRIDRENAFHGRFRGKSRKNRPRARLARSLCGKGEEKAGVRTCLRCDLWVFNR